MFLLHQGLGAKFAGAADLAEAELVALDGVRCEPVVATAIAIGATIGAKGDGQVRVIHQRPLTNPFNHVAVILLELDRITGAARDGRSGDGEQQQPLHCAAFWQVGQRCLSFSLAQPNSLMRALAAGCSGSLRSLVSTENSNSSTASQLSQLTFQV